MESGRGWRRSGCQRRALLALASVLVAGALLGGSAVASDLDALGPVGPAQVESGPNATLTVSPNPAHPGQTIVLDARNSTAPDGSISACEFDVDGDGTYDTQGGDCVVDYPYYAPGTYEIRVRVTTAGDRSATATETLVVTENEPPGARVAVDPPSPRPGDTVTLAADASDGDGRVVAYRWRVAGQNLTGETIETTFDAVGEYRVSLTVVDDDGATAVASTTVTVAANRPPDAALATPTPDARAGQDLSLDASETTDPDGPVVEYRWDFDGDGGVDRRTADATTAFTPSSAGEYAVTVTAVDDRGATDAATVRFAVAPADATSAASESPPDGGSGDDGGGLLGPADRGVVPLLPDLVALLLVLLLGAGVGVAVRRRSALQQRVETLRELLTRGDVRRKLAKKVSGAAVKKVAKTAVRRLSDLVEAGGELVGNAVEGVGRAIKRGTRRVAEWLRRLGS